MLTTERRSVTPSHAALSGVQLFLAPAVIQLLTVATWSALSGVPPIGIWTPHGGGAVSLP
jgi:hypothetical protein